MDKYFWYIFASYVVTFGSILFLMVFVMVNYHSAKNRLAQLQEQGIRRRSESKKQQ